uniref:Rab5 GDP/GTP exchange factor n=1 Tax=Leptobrachium leishanense TaxID=445787 RepID=A0A8C5PX28_9ANUR
MESRHWYKFKMNLAHPNEDQPIQPHETTFDFNGFVFQPEKCRKNCGYYGNPIWHGYCSRCWIQQRQNSRAPPLTDGFRHHTGTFVEKHDEARTGELWKIPDTSRSISRSHGQTAHRPIPPIECQDSLPLVPWPCLHSLGQGDFSDFLKTLQRPEAQQLMIHCTKFVQRLQDAESLSLDAKGEQVQEFYHFLAKLYPDQMTEERDRLLDNIEKLVMTRLYKSVFCLDGCQDVQKDLSLQARIRSLSWVNPKMLQLTLHEDDQEANDLIFNAVTALVEMDSKRAPQDKLACLSRASDFLFKAISSSKMEPVTADDFLSYLIFTLLKANSPRLISNLQYITRFSNPKRLVAGKDGYCFTNICCAVSFLENIKASSLGLTQKEFSQLMQEDCLAFGSCHFVEQDTTRQIQENKKLLSDLHSRQDRLMKEAECLNKEVRNWPLAVKEEIQEIIRKFPLAIKQTKTNNS